MEEEGERSDKDMKILSLKHRRGVMIYGREMGSCVKMQTVTGNKRFSNVTGSEGFI